MSITNRETPFAVAVDHDPERRTFTAVRELGFNKRGTFVIDAHTTPPGGPRGGYFTSIPISPLVWRREHGNEDVAFRRDRGRITLWDDWGKPHTIEAPDDILDALVAECVAQEIPERVPTEDGRDR